MVGTWFFYFFLPTSWPRKSQRWRASLKAPGPNELVYSRQKHHCENKAYYTTCNLKCKITSFFFKKLYRLNESCSEWTKKKNNPADYFLPNVGINKRLVISVFRICSVFASFGEKIYPIPPSRCSWKRAGFWIPSRNPFWLFWPHHRRTLQEGGGMVDFW